MISRTTRRFRSALAELPLEVRRQARRAYRLFKENPNHPSLRFKPVHSSRPIYSARIGTSYRAVGLRVDDEIVWFWIGSHRDYERLLSRHRHKRRR